MTSRTRRTQRDDFPTIADIVNHYIRTGSINFRENPQTADDWHAEWEPIKDRYPWLVHERNGAVAGIAYATPWNLRTAYQWAVEVTIYVAHTHHGAGIGTELYRRLLELIDAQGYRSALAVVTLPNPASVALHESSGFEHVGTLSQIGFKHDEWHDVGLWHRLGDPDAGDPDTIRSVDEIFG